MGEKERLTVSGSPWPMKSPEKVLLMKGGGSCDNGVGDEEIY